MDEENKKPTGSFKVSGFPINDEIDVPDEDEPKKPKNIGIMFNMDKPEESMTALLQALGVDDADFEKELKKYLKDPTQLLRDFGADDFVNNEDFFEHMKRSGDSDDDVDDEDNEDTDEEEGDALPFKFGSILTLLDSNNIWSIKCKQDPDLYHKFTEKFGDSNLSFESFPPSMQMIDDSRVFQAGNIGKMSVIDYTDKYVLLACESKKPEEVNVYIAAYETPSGDIELYVPLYGNTFKAEDGSFFSTANIEDKPYFDNNGKFVLTDIDKIETGLDMLFVPEKHPLITPNKFGTFKKMINNVPREGSSALRIGVLQSNESTDAKMFKRDFDFPAEKTKFDFYLKFNDIFSYEELLALSDELFSKLDYASLPIFDECELKVKGDALYIEVDTGKLSENIRRWWNDEGNAY